MSRVGSDEITSSKILKSKRTLAYLNTNLSVSDSGFTQNPFDQIKENLGALKKGFKHFNQSSTSNNEVSVTEIKVGDLTYKVYDKEKQLVDRVSKKLRSDVKLTLTLFKQFLASNNESKEWIEYVLEPTRRAGISNQKFNELDSHVETSFVEFYFAERIACFKILSKLILIKQEPLHSGAEMAQEILYSIRTTDANGDTLQLLFDQLKSEVFMVNSSIQHVYLQQLFSEYRVLIEYIILSIGDDVPYDASHVHTYIRWLLNSGTKKVVERSLLSSATYNSAVIAEACETSLLLHLLQFDKILYQSDESSQQVPALAQDPKLFADLVLDLDKLSTVPSDCIVYRAITLLALTTKTYFISLPKLNEPQVYFMSKLDSNKDGACLADTLYTSFDHALTYKQLLDLLCCPLFELDPELSLPFKMSYRLFLMAVAATRPHEFIENTQPIVRCITALYEEDYYLCKLFWDKDCSIPSRSMFLQLTATYFPVYHQLFLHLLHTLTNLTKDSIHKVADYLRAIPHFTQEFGSDLQLVADVQRPSNSSVFCVLPKQDIDLINLPGFSKFSLGSTSRGCLAVSSGGDSNYVIWTKTYTLFDYLLCLLSGLGEPTTSARLLQTHSQFVFGCLDVLANILSADYSLLATLLKTKVVEDEELPSDDAEIQDKDSDADLQSEKIDVELQSEEVGVELQSEEVDVELQSEKVDVELQNKNVELQGEDVDVKLQGEFVRLQGATLFAHRITQLIDRVLAGPPSLRTFVPVTLKVLSNLLPTYPDIVVKYLALNSYKFAHLQDKSSVPGLIFGSDVFSRRYEITIAYLEFLLSLSNFLHGQATLDLDCAENSTFYLLRQFLVDCLPIVMQDIHCDYLNWQFAESTQRSKIGMLCLHIFNTFYQPNHGSLEAKLDGPVQVLDTYFFNEEKRACYTPVLSFLSAARALFFKLDSLGMVRPSQEIISLLETSLQFLNNVFKRSLQATKSKRPKTWCLTSLFAFQANKPPMCPVGELIKLLDTRLGSKIVTESANLLTSICSNLSFQNLSLISEAQPNLEQIAFNIYTLLEGNSVNGVCRSELWNFVAATQVYQPAFFEALFRTNSPVAAHRSRETTVIYHPGKLPLLGDLCLEAVDRWDDLILNHAWTAVVFVRFLRNLWSNKSKCTEILNDLADRIGLFPFIKKLLITAYDPGEPGLNTSVDAVAGFGFQIVIAELEHRITSSTYYPSTASSDFKQLLQLCVNNYFGYQQFSQIQQLEAASLIQLQQEFKDAGHDAHALRNFGSCFFHSPFSEARRFGPMFGLDSDALLTSLLPPFQSLDSSKIFVSLKFEVECFNLESTRVMASLTRLRHFCSTVLLLLQSNYCAVWSDNNAKFEFVQHIVRELSRFYALELDTAPVSSVLATLLADFLHQFLQLVVCFDWDLNSEKLTRFYLEVADVVLDAVTMDAEGEHPTEGDQSAYCLATTIWYKSFNLVLATLGLDSELLAKPALLEQFDALKSRAIKLITQDYAIVESWLYQDASITSEPFILVEASLNVINCLSLNQESALDDVEAEDVTSYVSFLVRLLERLLINNEVDMSKLLCSVLNVLNRFKVKLHLVDPDTLTLLVELLLLIKIPDPKLTLEPHTAYTWMFTLQVLQTISHLDVTHASLVFNLLAQNWSTVCAWVHHVQLGLNRSCTTPFQFSEVLLLHAILDSVDLNLSLLSHGSKIDHLVRDLHHIVPRLVLLVVDPSLDTVRISENEAQFAQKFCCPRAASITPTQSDLGVVVLHQLASSGLRLICTCTTSSNEHHAQLSLTTFNRRHNRISFGTLIDLLASFAVHLEPIYPLRANEPTPSISIYQLAYLNQYLDRYYFILDLLVDQLTIVNRTNAPHLVTDLKKDLQIELATQLTELINLEQLVTKHLTRLDPVKELVHQVLDMISS